MTAVVTGPAHVCRHLVEHKIFHNKTPSQDWVRSNFSESHMIAFLQQFQNSVARYKAEFPMIASTLFHPVSYIYPTSSIYTTANLGSNPHPAALILLTFCERAEFWITDLVLITLGLRHRYREGSLSISLAYEHSGRPLGTCKQWLCIPTATAYPCAVEAHPEQ